MNAITKTKTVDAILGTVADASNATWYGDIETASPVTAKTNRFYAMMERWTQSSFEAWEKRSYGDYI
jgi:hypothetical protein